MLDFITLYLLPFIIFLLTILVMGVFRNLVFLRDIKPLIAWLRPIFLIVFLIEMAAFFHMGKAANSQGLTASATCWNFCGVVIMLSGGQTIWEIYRKRNRGGI